MRILFLSQLFTPEPRPPKGINFAKALVSRGHEVEIVTAFPNYPEGKLYEGYPLKFYRKDVLDGITIHRFPVIPSHDQSGIKRAITYLSWSLGVALRARFIVGRPDIVYMYQGPATTGIPANVLAKHFQVPYVMDIQDLWPDAVLASQMSKGKAVGKILTKYMNWLYRRASTIFVISETAKTELISRGVTEGKLELVYNWADESLLSLPVCSTEQPLEHFTVTYLGNLGKAQFLKPVIDAAKIVQSQSSRIQFVIAGGGTDLDDLRSHAEDLQLKNVTFLGRVDREKAAQVLSNADLMLVHLRDDPAFHTAIPSKIQEAFASGRPVLVCANGAARRLVEEARAGLWAEPAQSQLIADAIVSLSQMPRSSLLEMAENGREYYLHHMAFDYVVDRISQLLQVTVDRYKVVPAT